jgi:hypothetical protein
VQKRNLGWADVLAFSAFLTTACWLGLFAKFTSAIGISLMALAVLLVNRNTSRDFLRIGSASIGMFAIYALSHQVFIEPWSITITKFVRGHKNLLLLDPGYSNERALDNFRFGIVHWVQDRANNQYLADRHSAGVTLDFHCSASDSRAT